MSRRRARRQGAAPLPPAPAAVPPARLPAIDAWRGTAICLMIGYHLCFDLRYYRLLAADFERDPFWLGFRALIVTSFLTLVGVSLVLADRAGGSQRAYWRRIGLVAACALAASAGSWLLFPRTFIYFGILHCIAVSSLLARPLLRRPAAALACGLAVVAAGLALQAPAFDAPPLSWIGFTTRKPATEDYVPLFPWAGVVLVGVAAGHRLLAGGANALALGPLARAPAWLAWLGRHSLAVYMVHQPLLLGALWLLLRR